MFKRLDHVEIIPKDFDRSVKFYTEVLGFKLDHQYPVNAPAISEVAYLTLNESAIELLKAKTSLPAAGQPDHSGYRLMAWEVDSMAKTLGALAKKGVNATWGPRTTDAYIRAEITDPDGNSIELRQWFKRPELAPAR
jgi:glyoxylase I family protein